MPRKNKVDAGSTPRVRSGDIPLTPEQWELVTANTRLLGFAIGRWFRGVVRTPHWSYQEVVEDAAWDGLIHAARTWTPGRTVFGYWATYLIRQAIVNALRSRLPKLTREWTGTIVTTVGNGRGLAPTLPSRPLADVDADDEIRVRRRQIADALATLTQRSRRVVRWRLAGESYIEIAERLGCTRERARQIYTRAVAVMRDRVGGIR